MQWMKYLIIGWIFIVVTVWAILARYFPSVIGRAPDKNRQKIDHVTYNQCDRCEEGVIMPWFRWWRYMFQVSVPVANLWVIGPPDAYECTNCSYKREEDITWQWFTRISLVHDLPAGYVITFIVTFVLWIAGIILVGSWFFR